MDGHSVHLAPRLGKCRIAGVMGTLQMGPSDLCRHPCDPPQWTTMPGGSSAALARRTANRGTPGGLESAANGGRDRRGFDWCASCDPFSAVCSGHVATPVVDLGIEVGAGGFRLSCRARVRRQPRQLRFGQGDAPRVADRKRHPPHLGRRIAPSHLCRHASG